jgi:HK97 family phage prohead protease
MIMDTIDFALEVKGVSDAGLFEGYASTYGERDFGGDIVVAGAMTKSIKARGPKGIRMFADHDPRKRIGVWTEFTEDEKGLFVKGRLLLEKQDGKDAYIDLREGALDGLSIGFSVKSDSYDGRRKARMLKEIDLREISLVSFPMNDGARVTRVKSLLEIKTIREFEEALINGTLPALSAKEAKALLAGGFKAIRSERDAGEVSAELAEIIRRNTQLLVR